VNDQDKYELVLAEGVPRDVLDAYLYVPPPVPRRVDRRIIESAHRLDILDAQIESVRRSLHEETRARLERLGYDASRFEPLASSRPGETHLARVFNRHAPEATVGRGTLIRSSAGVVLGVR
jgi:hypothetical protein